MEVITNKPMLTAAATILDWIDVNPKFKKIFQSHFRGDSVDYIQFINNEKEMKGFEVKLEKDLVIKLIVALEWILDHPLISETLEKSSQNTVVYWPGMIRNVISDFKVAVA